MRSEKNKKKLNKVAITFLVVLILTITLLITKGKLFGKSIIWRNPDIASNIETFEIDIPNDMLRVGEEGVAKLKINDKEIKNAEFTTSDSDTVRVLDDGTIIGVKMGIAEITVKKYGKEATRKVYVIIPIDSIDLKSKYKVIDIDEEYDLSVSTSVAGYSLGFLEFYSSNPEVVDVDDNGHVKGLDEGVVDIYVKDKYTGKEDSISLRVKE